MLLFEILVQFCQMKNSATFNIRVCYNYKDDDNDDEENGKNGKKIMKEEE